MGFLPSVPKLTERRWTQQLIGEQGLARLFGWRWWHDRATNLPRQCPTCKTELRMIRNDPGWPDLFLIRDDTLIVAELKADRGRVSPEQQAWLDAFRRVRRIVVAVWKPRDVDEVTRMLR